MILTEKTNVMLNSKIKELESLYQSCPKGHLLIFHDNDRIRFYHSINGKRQYISKKNRELIISLLRKQYYEYALADLKLEANSNRDYIAFHKDNFMQFASFIQRLYGKNIKPTSALNTFTHSDDNFSNITEDEFELIIKAIFLSTDILSVSEETELWMHSPYQHNPNFPEHLIYSSPSGNKLRSKSEMIIDMCLYQKGIPYRYESEMVLDGICYYPDFTLRHPVSSKTVIWEHLGMMDNPTYIQKSYHKLEAYSLNGFIPGNNLIITSETKENPLNTQTILTTIDTFLKSSI